MNHKKQNMIGMLAVAASAMTLFTTSESFAQDEALKMTAIYQIEKDQRHGWLTVAFDIPEGKHIYALTQEGSPPPSELKLTESESFEVIRGFKANKKPKVIEFDEVFEQRIEKQVGKVKFQAAIRIPEGVNLEEVPFELLFNGQICNEAGCQPIFDKPIEVKFGGFYEKPKEKSAKEKSAQKEQKKKGN